MAQPPGVLKQQQTTPGAAADFQKALRALIPMSLLRILKDFNSKKKFQDYGELAEHKARCQCFSEDDDDLYDNDVIQKHCQQASAGSLEAL